MRDLIQSKISAMSRNQLRIAQFILDAPGEAAFLTASRMAERTGVSEATVVRFASFLGYAGFGKMREAISHSLLDTLSTLQRIERYHTEASEGYLDKIVDRDLETLAKVRERIPHEEIESLSEAVARADSVFIAASRSSFVLAYYLHYYLSWIRSSVTLLSESTAYEVLENAPSRSLVVGISFPRYTRWTVEVLAHAHEKGLDTGAVTDAIASPLAPHSTHVVYVPYSPVSFVDSFTAPLCMLNCLILSVSNRYGESLSERFGDLEALWVRNRTYLAPSKAPASTATDRG